MGSTEIVFVFLIYLLLFGAKGIPSLAKTMGEGVRHFRSATDDIQREILKTSNDIKSDFREVKKQASSVAEKAEMKENSDKS
jgi:sec-independent protein translocase protein TatA